MKTDSNIECSEKRDKVKWKSSKDVAGLFRYICAQVIENHNRETGT